jgi:membrane-associated phospholipid phosphatase
VSLVAWRHQRRLACLLVPIIAGLLVATVYGRFHYVLDTLAGVGLAIAVVSAYVHLIDLRLHRTR